jgi:3-phenylpropionate/trans-cinnamate dioxygenase ferredoxin reductase component
MYRAIVFGTDGSPTAAIAQEAAIELAARYRARIVAVSAFEPPGRPREWAEGVAREAEEAARARGVAGSSWAQRGEPADIVLQAAEREGADLIVVGNVGMGQASRFRLGSVPDRVAHYAGCDVLIVATSKPDIAPETPPGRYLTIVAGTDGSPTANDAVQRAFELALVHRARVVLVHVGDPVVGTIRLETVARSRPERVQVDLRTVQGDPAQQIAELAEQERADLIVVGNKGMSGARRYLLGSVPNRVAHSSPTDVLIVRTTDLSAADIEPGHGAVIDVDGRKTAAYRDPDGVLHSVGARCTHMGCIVGWNEGERTWDCPCHGSRYDSFGHVVRGPAKADLEGAPPREEEPEEAPAGTAAEGHPAVRSWAGQTFVIVGGGLTGATAAARLRAEGYDGRLILVGEENHHPYERPPLSKAFLRGEAPFEEALVHPVAFYRDHTIELRSATLVTGLDVDAQTVTLDTGESFEFDRCLLATGARNRRFPIPGLDLPGVFQLRTLAEAEAIRAAMAAGRRAVVAGMGFIGSEVAASLRQRGLDVVALASTPPLAGPLGPDIGEVLASIHRGHGVDLRVGEGLEAIEGDGRAARVRTKGGAILECDLVVAGLGVEPNVELAVQAGLAVDNGVVVDASFRTSHEAVFAAGDVASHLHPLADRHIRVEHWQNAIDHGQAVALAMLDRVEPYRKVPWFWSDQYEHNLQYAGFPGPWDELIVRGRLEERSFLAFYRSGGRVQAILAMNLGEDVPAAIRLIGTDGLDAPSLSDPEEDLSRLVPAR